MADLGGEAVNIVRGRPEELALRVDTWQTPGIDGVGSQTLGQGSEPSPLQTVAYFENDALAEAHIAACKALKGQVISMEDNWENEYENLLVIDVRTANSKRAVFRNNQAQVRVQIEWMVQAT
jgi:hypothetical protein